MNVQVLDDAGRTVDQDRDVAALKSRLLPRVQRRAVDDIRARFESRGLGRFPSAGVPETLVIRDGDNSAVVYPALRDDADCVDLVMLAHRSTQAVTNRRGYSRLALLADPRTSRYLRRQVEADKTMALCYATLGGREMLADELLLASVWACFFAASPREKRSLPRTRSAFDALIDGRRTHLTGIFASLLESSREIWIGVLRWRTGSPHSIRPRSRQAGTTWPRISNVSCPPTFRIVFRWKDSRTYRGTCERWPTGRTILRAAVSRIGKTWPRLRDGRQGRGRSQMLCPATRR